MRLAEASAADGGQPPSDQLSSIHCNHGIPIPKTTGKRGVSIAPGGALDIHKLSLGNVTRLTRTRRLPIGHIVSGYVEKSARGGIRMILLLNEDVIMIEKILQ